jgi:hypothetical protein
MIAVSNDFKNAMTQPIKEIDAYINGSVTLKSEDDLISFKISCDSGMCKSAMRKLEAKYLGEHNLLGQWVHVGYGVKLPNGTYEYLDFGSFLVTEITTVKDTGVTTIVGYDKMVNSMREYTKLNIEYPITLIDYTRLLCEACGLELANNSFTTHNDWLINQELWENINGITYRDILVQIAQVTGTTCIISNEDKVYFKPLTETGEQLTYNNMLKLKLEPMYGEINSVILARTPQEDNIFKRDEDSIKSNGLTEFKIENNEIIDKDRDKALTPIYEALHGISYYPFETTTEGLGWYEIADSITIVNDTGDLFKTSIFNYTITIDGAVKEILKTVANTKTQTQYQYATTLGKRVKNTEIIVDKQNQEITSLVTDMYAEGGIINENFTKIEQDIHNIINSVQNSGGNNLIKNSVMFAYDTNKKPNDWYVTNGVNIFDGIYELANINSTTGNKVVSTAIISTVNYHEVAENMTFTLQFSTEATGCIIFCYDKDKKFINYVGVSIKTVNGVRYTTFTTLPNTRYIMWRFNNGFTDINSKSQLELGYKPSTYKDYIEGNIIIDSNTESLTAGGLSGHSFTLLDKIATQKVAVSTDTQYTFSTKIKKDTTGSCYVRVYNSNEEYIINIPAGENVFYKDYEIKDLKPKNNYYIIEFYGSADSGATFTDNMLSVGSYKSPWQQANGEVMNTQVNVNLEGVLVKSSIYLGDYTVMSPLEFAGYSNINGTITKVFSLNKDVTLVKKLEAEDEVKMVPIKVVPITSGDLQGWAFVPST